MGKKGANDYSTGWGRRSKKRPKRTDSAGEASVAAGGGTLESATSPPQEITLPNEITQEDRQEGTRPSEIYPANDNVPYHPHYAPQDPRKPESTNLSSPVLEPMVSRYYPRTVSYQGTLPRDLPGKRIDRPNNLMI